MSLRLLGFFVALLSLHAPAAHAYPYKFGGDSFEFTLPPGDCFLEKTTERAQRFYADVERIPNPNGRYLFIATRCTALDAFHAGQDLFSYYFVMGQLNPNTGEDLVLPGVTRSMFARQAAKMPSTALDEASDRAKEHVANAQHQIELKSMKLGVPQVESDIVYMPLAMNMQTPLGVNIGYAGLNGMVLMSGRLFSVVTLAPHEGEKTYQALFSHTREIVGAILAANPGSERALPKRESREVQLPSAPLAAEKPTADPSASTPAIADAADETPQAETTVADEKPSAPAGSDRGLKGIVGFVVILLAVVGLVAIVMWTVSRLRRR